MLTLLTSKLNQGVKNNTANEDGGAGEEAGGGDLSEKHAMSERLAMGRLKTILRSFKSFRLTERVSGTRLACSRNHQRLSRDDHMASNVVGLL